MDTSLVTAFIGASVGQAQLAVAAKLLQMNADAAQSAGQIIDAAQQNMNSLANVATGVGTTVDISA
jgi:hypothetical protein